MVKIISLQRPEPRPEQQAASAADWVNLHVRFKRPEHEFLDRLAKDEGGSKNGPRRADRSVIMNRRLPWLYSFATAVLVVCALGVAPLRASWPCCNDASECTDPDRVCCDPEVLEPCYGTWVPFDQIDGYCMTVSQCFMLN
jgi:hypothetical protein